MSPTCLKSDQEVKNITLVYDPFPRNRIIKVNFFNSTYKLDLRTYNVSDCLDYLSINEDNSHTLECLHDRWFEPNSCKIDHSSFVFKNDERNRGTYITPVPILRGFVQYHDNCGAILTRKITESDIEWIDSNVYANEK